MNYIPINEIEAMRENGFVILRFSSEERRNLKMNTESLVRWIWIVIDPKTSAVVGYNDRDIFDDYEN